MADPYHINLEEFSLERFKHTLTPAELLPGRQILLHEIEERFAVLNAMGIRNLAELIVALRTKRKIDAFARRSRLPRDYLVILGRQARSYIPKPAYLRDIPRVNAENVEKLAVVGIKHTKHLFARAQSPRDRAELSAVTGVPSCDLLELLKLADLARIGGLGPVFVRLFYETGVDTVEKLSHWAPDEFYKRAHAVNREHKLSKVVPSLKDITHYIETAEELPKVIQYS